MGCYLQSESTVAPRGVKVKMPASVNETVTASLLLSLSSKSGPENGEVPLDQRMAAASKRVLLSDIEYVPSTDTYHNSVLQTLKAKYSDQNDKCRLTNGSGPSQAGTKAAVQIGNPSLPTPARVLYAMEKVQMQWPTRCNNGSGFMNAGNSCYLNSVLQALFHIPPLFNWLMEGDQVHQRNCPTYNNTTPECIICCMAVTLKQSQQRTGHDTRPHLILQRLRSICRRLIPGQQEDAMEFLRYLFEAMEKNYLQRFSQMKLDTYSKETTPLNQIFGGYIRTDVTCLHCKEVSTTFQHFLDLTLDISRGSSLEYALDTYFSQEKLEGDNSYRCDKCRRKVPAAKQFFIERLPNVLCVQLKRFSIEGKKISKSLQLAERINLQRFLSRPRVTGSPQVPRPRACYRLAAGVNHLGHTAQSGHYTTTAYVASGGLYLFDDSCVQRQWNRGFSGTDVYLLMYVLESNKQLAPQQTLPAPSATATSSPQLGPRPIPKVASSPNTAFVPSQCRKPSIILNQNRKIVFGPENKATLVTTSPGLANNKVTKLGVIIPTSKESTTTMVQSSSSTSNGFTPTKERIVMKIKNGHRFGPGELPSLVPYNEEHSSGDEASKSAEAASSTNGWTVTDNGHKSPSESEKKSKPSMEYSNGPSVECSPVKAPKIPANDIHKAVQASIKSNTMDVLKKLNLEAIKKTAVKSVENKRLSNGDSSRSEGECSVKSTTSSWQVTDSETASERSLALVEPRTASWVITPAPSSEPTSSEPSPGRLPSPSPSLSSNKSSQQQRSSVKRKTPSPDSSSDGDSSSSDSSDSEAPPKKKQSMEMDKYEWVERTKETILSNSKHKTPSKQPSSQKVYDPTPTVSDELRKMSHSGYGGTHVSTWNGGRSLVDRQVKDDRREQKKANQDCDYDPEIDGGRRKKVKSHEAGYENGELSSSMSKGNRFQQEIDYRRQQDVNNRRYGYDRQQHWQKRGQGGYYQKPEWRNNWGTQHHHNDRRYNNHRHRHHSYRQSNNQHYNRRY